jgi:glucose-1-phosphate cytidylyltransferase
VVILAGGLGTRLREETEVRPKPMVEIGGRPILWHIMQHYAHYGFKEFVVALGYKGEVIKRYFTEYHALSGSMTVSLATGKVEVHGGQREDWTVHLVDTGLQTPTGSRVKRLESWLKGGPFMVTYGDGVSDVDLQALLRFHREHGKLVTVTAVRPPARFGGIVFDDDAAARFSEKPQTGEGWINGGFLVCEPAVLDYLQADGTSLEKDAIEEIAAKGQLVAYQHPGFWQCMDVLRDAQYLESLWQGGRAPWKVWER